MKTKTILVTIFALVVATVATGVEKPKMNVQSLDSKELLVTFKSPVNSKIEISILNELNELVYYKQSKKPLSGFNKIFDINNLEDGSYAMKVESNGTVLANNFTIDKKNVTVSKTEEYWAPFFAFQNNKLIITHLNFSKERFAISISDDVGLIYKSKLTSKSPLNSGFDLSNLKKGTYYVSLNSGNNNYAYQLEKKE